MERKLFSGALFGTAAQALAFWAPKETFGPAMAADAIIPRPTVPPIFRELRKRQSSSSSTRGGETYIIGPDQTCGFINGLPGQMPCLQWTHWLEHCC